ncbi:MAG: dockerin type I repeat-containing protein [candidate division Zixibacteria bacterium]|nr:dockerin type I repeat-containing protein [candidate division Zixibacteria bacterium]
MKGERLVLSLILLLGLIFSISKAYAQDPGAPDTVYFTTKYNGLFYPLPSGPGLAFIHINFFNDDSVAGISAPFIFSGPVVYDSTTFRDSRVNYMLYKNVNETLIGSNKVLLSAIPVTEHIIGPGRGYLATLCFRVIGDTGHVVVDTAFFPPSNHLTFVTSEPEGYTPIFIKGVLPVVAYKPGDANHDMTVNVTDVIFLINYLFKNGPPPYPFVAADVNASCDINVVDVIYLINYLFKGGPPPKPGCDW